MSELGKVCEHRQLERQCPLCEKDQRIAELETELAGNNYTGAMVKELEDKIRDLEARIAEQARALQRIIELGKYMPDTTEERLFRRLG